ncbi:MAG: succinate dehydrogenase [Elusimicrobia bacterium]|jgi:succinate dehydrogenase / fumarate reductase membrane anchor subunit|nr:succinate dehydrogenase [Elusimicrobiota bacterium]
MSSLSAQGTRPVPSGGFERFAWFFMRISGVVLLFLALGHLTIMHLVNSIDHVNFAFVAARYVTPFWRTYDGLLLILALLHGFNGLRVVFDDYLKGFKRLIAVALSGVLCLALLLLGLYIVFTFQSPSSPADIPHETNTHTSL